MIQHRLRVILFPLVALALLLMDAVPVSADLDLNDGGVHDFPPLDSLEDVVVSDGPGMAPTTVNVFASGDIVGNLLLFDQSMANVSGGQIAGDIEASDVSTANISGGQIAGSVLLFNSAMANISGGQIAGGVETADGSSVGISGGAQIGDGIFASDNSIVMIADGMVALDVLAFGSSHVMISGGMVGGFVQAFEDSRVTISGGLFGEAIEAYDDSVIRLLGTFDMDFGNYGPGTFFLTGTLADGTPFANDVFIDGSARITLAPPPVTQPIPEPASVLVWSLVCALAGAYVIGKRRRANAVP